MHWRNREIPKAFTQKGEVKQAAVEGHDDPSFRQCPSECGFVASSYVDIILRAGAPADERHLVVVDAESGRLDVQKNRFRGVRPVSDTLRRQAFFFTSLHVFSISTDAARACRANASWVPSALAASSLPGAPFLERRASGVRQLQS